MCLKICMVCHIKCLLFCMDTFYTILQLSLSFSYHHTWLSIKKEGNLFNPACTNKCPDAVERMFAFARVASILSHSIEERSREQCMAFHASITYVFARLLSERHINIMWIGGPSAISLQHKKNNAIY